MALDKTKEADRFMDEYELRIENLKQALGDRRHQLLVSVATISSAYGIWAYGEKHPVGMVLNDIGFQRPLAQRGNFYYINNISEERLANIDGNVLFFLVHGNRRDREILEELQQRPLWRQLKAVQQNQVYFVDAGHWYSMDILAINAIIDDLFKYLVNAP
ncbi:ABC transporter substrate-binding protein [Chlorogloeopsis fritschii]|uniref:ABC transporter substrate-binding protein n=1 Tax=Chlorogloeopsis fritschii TaxID=1124 RepID=UPI0022845878|nr:ABC transporter substrate-binding protein [Chlorogloeopsis fritschii]